jgi:hypothetical protein
MGLNPFRPQTVSPVDVVIMVAAFVIVGLLVAWAVFG